MLTTLEVIFWVHDIAHTLSDVVVADVAPSDRHSVHSHDATGVLTLITKGVGQAKHRLDVALCLQTL